MKAKGFIGFLIISSANVFGGSVLWNTFSYGPHTDETGMYPEYNSYLHGLVLPLEDSSVSLGIALNTTLSPGHTHAMLTAVTSTFFLGYPSSWRVFNHGDFVAYDAIYGDYDDYFYRLTDVAHQDRNLTIASGGTAYLGFSMGGSIYGWVQLGFDGNVVYVVNSLVDYSRSGTPIQIGLVPEPATGGLLFAGGAAFLLRRKRRNALRSGG
jgi:hypothetical protein